MQKGIVVGIDTQGNDKIYRVLVCNIQENSKGKCFYDWAFKCVTMDTSRIISQIMTDKNFFLNLGIDNSGKITGKSASLSRFDDNKSGRHPLVIISQISTTDGRLIGYKAATYDGNVRNISLKEMIAYGNRTTKQGLIPVQNAIFVAEDEATGKKAHFKSYPNMPFITELYEVGKNKYSEQNRRVPVRQNEKTLVKASEIFDKEQMEQLKLGKQHKVDIRIYANPKISAKKMKILRAGLEKGLNIKPFAFPEYKELCMMYYVDCLENGIDIRPMLNPKYNEGHLFQLALAVELGLDISKMCNPSLSANDMEEIRERLEANIWKDELVKKDGTWK